MQDGSADNSKTSSDIGLLDGDPGSAPVVQDQSALEPPPPATSRILVVLTYLLVLLLLGLRVPQVYAELHRRVPAKLSASIHDKGLEALAVKTGVFLAFLVTALAVAIFFGLARVLEKRVFSGTLGLSARLSVGLYCLVVALSVLPWQLLGVISGAADPQRGLLLHMYVACVGLLAPLLYRSTWRDLGTGPIALIFTTSIGLAALTVIG